MNKPRQPRYAQIFQEDAVKAEVATQTWQETIEHLIENDFLSARRVAIADRYARSYAEYEVLYLIAATEGPVKVGPNGGDVFNFNWSACEKLNDRILKFEEQLLITPKAAGFSLKEQKNDAKKTAADDYFIRAQRPDH
ncbi:MAG: P27 family phage terminase small subunit [Pseudomonadota bacterium]